MAAMKPAGPPPTTTTFVGATMHGEQPRPCRCAPTRSARRSAPLVPGANGAKAAQRRPASALALLVHLAVRKVSEHTDSDSMQRRASTAGLRPARQCARGVSAVYAHQRSDHRCRMPPAAPDEHLKPVWHLPRPTRTLLIETRCCESWPPGQGAECLFACPDGTGRACG